MSSRVVSALTSEEFIELESTLKENHFYFISISDMEKGAMCPCDEDTANSVEAIGEM